MNIDGFEIERKFLIKYPKKSFFDHCSSKSEITQTYLVKKDDGMNARVRKREYADRIEYTHTRKKHISDIRRIEEEFEIDEEQYNYLLKEADKKRNVIKKFRYCIENEGHVFEIDVFPFWDDRAVMEVELSNEDEKFKTPPEIEIIKEITQDKRYTNSSLAKAIPYEII